MGHNEAHLVLVVKKPEPNHFHCLIFRLRSETHAERMAALITQYVNAAFAKVRASIKHHRP